MSGFLVDFILPIIISTLIAIALDKNQGWHQEKKDLLEYLDDIGLCIQKFWCGNGSETNSSEKRELEYKVGKVREKIEELLYRKTFPQQLSDSFNKFENESTGGEFSSPNRNSEEHDAAKIKALDRSLKELRSTIRSHIITRLMLTYWLSDKKASCMKIFTRKG